MLKQVLVTLIASMLTLSNAFSCVMNEKTGETGFLPENNLKIAIGSKMANDMTKETFMATIDRVTNTLQPFFTKQGAKLTANKKWDDNTVNASAMQYGNGDWRINMFGGLARHQLVTVDGFMIVICHEIGHHIGGAPRGQSNTSWASVEGQSDYFAALKCMKRVIETDDNISIVAGMQVDPEVKKQCQLVYKSESEVAICERIAMAGNSVAKLLASFGDKPDISFTTPDTSVVSRTSEEHPKAQCRMDTLFQATLCDKNINDEVSKDNPIPGTCISKDGYTKGVRPLCWYKPGNKEI